MQEREKKATPPSERLPRDFGQTQVADRLSFSAWLYAKNGAPPAGLSKRRI